ncbi:PAS domain-containing protein [Mucilaginibacter sp.]|uniref:PAS domain-containing protein n=1 Tax=Mucilaginibacter sp. TaxID=1882438 RepID=UPI003263C984
MNNIFLAPDKEKNYQSYMVYALAIIWLMVTGLVVFIEFFYFPQLWLRWVLLMSITLFIAAFNLTLNHLGRTRTASWSLTVMLWLYITIPCYSAGGIFAPGILSQMSVVLTAGFLLGRRGGLIIGLLTIATDLGLAYLEVTGHLPAATVVHDPISRWFSAIIPFGTVLVLQYYAINHLRTSLISLQRQIIKRKEAEAVTDQTVHDLREREKELKDYKYALDISSIVAISDVDGSFTFVNENFCKISKYSPEELLGKEHSVLWSGYHPTEYFTELGIAMQEGKFYRGEFCNKAKDGSLYWVDTTIVPFLNDEGNVYQYMSINRDITRKKEALEKLRASEERYKSIIAVSNTGAWEYDLDTQRVWYSAQYFAMLGLDRPDGVWEDTQGMSWVERLHPDDRERAVKIFDDFLMGGTTELYESFFRMRHQNGDWVWIWSRARRLHDNNGNITNVSLGTHTDISERIKAEEKTRESEQLIKKITSQVPGDTYMFEIEESGQTNIIFCNRGTDRLNHSHNPENPATDPTKIREIVHDDDKAKFDEAMRAAWLTGAIISFQYRVVINSHVSWRWMQAVSEKSTNGKILWYGAISDITPLVDYIVSIEQIIFDIAHVIRRPIASMMGITALISDNEFSEEEIKELSEKLHLISDEMNKFILELNRVYHEKRENTALNIDISSLIDERNSLFN